MATLVVVQYSIAVDATATSTAITCKDEPYGIVSPVRGEIKKTRRESNAGDSERRCR